MKIKKILSFFTLVLGVISYSDINTTYSEVLVNGKQVSNSPYQEPFTKQDKYENLYIRKYLEKFSEIIEFLNYHTLNNDTKHEFESKLQLLEQYKNDFKLELELDTDSNPTIKNYYQQAFNNLPTIREGMLLYKDGSSLYSEDERLSHMYFLYLLDMEYYMYKLWLAKEEHSLLREDDNCVALNNYLEEYTNTSNKRRMFKYFLESHYENINEKYKIQENPLKYEHHKYFEKFDDTFREEIYNDRLIYQNFAKVMRNLNSLKVMDERDINFDDNVYGNLNGLLKTSKINGLRKTSKNVKVLANNTLGFNLSVPQQIDKINDIKVGGFIQYSHLKDANTLGIGSTLNLNTEYGKVKSFLRYRLDVIKFKDKTLMYWRNYNIEDIYKGSYGYYVSQPLDLPDKTLYNHNIDLYTRYDYTFSPLKNLKLTPNVDMLFSYGYLSLNKDKFIHTITTKGSLGLRLDYNIRNDISVYSDNRFILDISNIIIREYGALDTLKTKLNSLNIDTDYNLRLGAKYTIKDVNIDGSLGVKGNMQNLPVFSLGVNVGYNF